MQGEGWEADPRGKGWEADPRGEGGEADLRGEGGEADPLQPLQPLYLLSQQPGVLQALLLGDRVQDIQLNKRRIFLGDRYLEVSQ